MQQDDHLAQKIIGTPAHLLEVRSHRAVAFIDIPGTESLQPTVSLKLMQQVAFRHRARTVELKSPHIALSGLGKDLLKTQWQAPTVLILGKGIAAMCITDGHPDRAFASRCIPYRSRLALRQHTLTFGQLRSISFKRLIISVYNIK